MIGLGVCQVTLGFGEKLGLAAVLVALTGLAFVGTMIRLGTAILQVTPDEFRGRMTSLSANVLLAVPALLMSGVPSFRGGRPNSSECN